MRFRQMMYFGKYKAVDGPMTEYATNIARQAKTLDPPMTDQEIIQTVRQHFDSDVARELRPSVVRNVSELIEMLETIENERETRKLRLESRNNPEKRVTRYNGDSNNRLMHRKSTRTDNNRTIPSIRDSASRTRVQPSIGWRKANSSEGSQNEGVDIVELQVTKKARNP